MVLRKIGANEFLIYDFERIGEVKRFLDVADPGVYRWRVSRCQADECDALNYSNYRELLNGLLEYTYVVREERSYVHLVEGDHMVAIKHWCRVPEYNVVNRILCDAIATKHKNLAIHVIRFSSETAVWAATCDYPCYTLPFTMSNSFCSNFDDLVKAYKYIASLIHSFAWLKHVVIIEGLGDAMDEMDTAQAGWVIRMLYKLRAMMNSSSLTVFIQADNENIQLPRDSVTVDDIGAICSYREYRENALRYAGVEVGKDKVFY